MGLRSIWRKYASQPTERRWAIGLTVASFAACGIMALASLTWPYVAWPKFLFGVCVVFFVIGLAMMWHAKPEADAEIEKNVQLHGLHEGLAELRKAVEGKNEREALTDLAKRGEALATEIETWFNDWFKNDIDPFPRGQATIAAQAARTWLIADEGGFNEGRVSLDYQQRFNHDVLRLRTAFAAMDLFDGELDTVYPHTRGQFDNRVVLVAVNGLRRLAEAAKARAAAIPSQPARGPSSPEPQAQPHITAVELRADIRVPSETEADRGAVSIMVLGIKNLGPTDEFQAQIVGWGQGNFPDPMRGPETLTWFQGNRTPRRIVTGMTEYLEIAWLFREPAEAKGGVATVSIDWDHRGYLGTHSYWEAADFTTQIWTLDILVSAAGAVAPHRQHIRLHLLGKIADDPTGNLQKRGPLAHPTLRMSVLTQPSRRSELSSEAPRLPESAS